MPGFGAGVRDHHPWFWTGTYVPEGLAYIYYGHDRSFGLQAEISRAGQVICIDDDAPPAAGADRR